MIRQRTHTYHQKTADVLAAIYSNYQINSPTLAAICRTESFHTSACACACTRVHSHCTHTKTHAQHVETYSVHTVLHVHCMHTQRHAHAPISHTVSHSQGVMREVRGGNWAEVHRDPNNVALCHFHPPRQIENNSREHQKHLHYSTCHISFQISSSPARLSLLRLPSCPPSFTF